jgi:hypothetical protein
VRPANLQPKYDGVTPEGITAQDEREAIYLRDHGRCRTCGKRVAWDEFELAHLIANTVANRKRWGDEIIDSPLNKATTCRGKCNDAQNIGNDPQECGELVNRIWEERENHE